MMRTSILCLLLTMVSCSAPQPVHTLEPAATLESDLAERFREHDAHPVEVAALVVDLDTGETLVSRQAQRLLRPASTMKVLTTAAACRRAPDREVVTSLSADARPVGAITLHGGADPFLSTDDLRTLVRSLKEQGVERVRDGELVLADPVGSILADYINLGELHEKNAGWLVEGIGEDFIPSIAEFDRVKKAYAISDAESFSAARELLRNEGLLAGSSSGTLLSAALKYCREQTTPKNVVSFACDTGNKYLSKLYNDFWLEDQGFTKRDSRGDLTDLIGRLHDEHATITVGPDDVLTTAHNRLRNAGISQLPVMDDGTLVGVVDEDAIIRHVFRDPLLMNAPVRDAMITAYIRLDADTSVNNLVAMLHVQPYAAVMDGDHFLGLITRADVLNHLRKQV